MKKEVKIFIIFLCTAYLCINLIVGYCFSQSTDKKTNPYLVSEKRGIWIRPPAEVDKKEIKKILDDLQTAGFNMVFLETFYHGFTIYPSKIFPQRPEYRGKDILQLFLNEAKKRNIELHCWLEVFYWRPTPETNFPQTPVLDENPDWLDLNINGLTTEKFENLHYFVNPSVPAVREKLVNLVKELCEKYKINGINLDYIRYAEGTTEFGYHSYAIEKFKKEAGFDPRSIDPKKNPVQWEQWCKFRERQVTEVVELISKTVKQCNKKISVSAAVFPGYYKKRYGDSRLQDWATWCEKGYLDFLTPMCYSYTLPNIKSEIELSKSYAKTVPVYPGLAAKADTPHPDLIQQIKLTRALTCPGYVVFCYSWITTFPNIFEKLSKEVDR